MCNKNVILGLSLCLGILVSTILVAEPVPVRLKDVANIVEARDNQLMGYGLVVGLRNTGDSRNAGFTEQSLTNMLRKMGISGSPREFGSRNVASVMVTAILPPFIKKGQRVSVVVSSLGDSVSLSGGTLIMTPLMGADMQVYAVAQGSLLDGGTAEKSAQGRYYKNQATVGTIPQGAIVENEVPVTFQDQHNVTIVLKEPNFVNATRLSQALRLNGFANARAQDPNTIKIPLSDLESTDLVTAISQMQNISFIPDASAKVVIDSRTGTIVIGEMVRLFPVALTHGGVSIRISDGEAAAGPAPGGVAGFGQAETIRVESPDNRMVYLNPSATLSSLVNALNEIGASPRDLISIIQALKESGSLIADLEII
jgi:flagellar P-ring protein FlgI